MTKPKTAPKKPATKAAAQKSVKPKPAKPLTTAQKAESLTAYQSRCKAANATSAAPTESKLTILESLGAKNNAAAPSGKETPQV